MLICFCGLVTPSTWRSGLVMDFDKYSNFFSIQKQLRLKLIYRKERPFTPEIGLMPPLRNFYFENAGSFFTADFALQMWISNVARHHTLVGDKC